MISFECDYCNGASKQILQAIISNNDVQTLTYGYDEFSYRAKEKIKLACNKEDLSIYFFAGGTQTNSTVIDFVLKTYQGVVCAATGHINVHEAGAIEASGHKVIVVDSKDGKISAEALKTYLVNFYNDETSEHIVQPGMVYITFPTELGTIYSLKELSDISSVCKQYKIPLYLDGARLGYGLMSQGNDVTLNDICNLCDIFYIGATKIGALCAEALVFTKPDKDKFFFTVQKQHGAVMAKSRFLGLQFDTLFTDNLYFKLSKHAIQMANELKKIFQKNNISFFVNSPTNQQFVILHNSLMHYLEEDFLFSHIQPYNKEYTVCRFVTSFSTKQEEIEILKNKIEEYFLNHCNK